MEDLRAAGRGEGGRSGRATEILRGNEHARRGGGEHERRGKEKVRLELLG